MGFKIENYTRMGIAMPLFIGIFLSIFVPKISAQSSNSQESCLITVLEEPRPTARAKGTRYVQSVKNTFRSVDWTGLSNGRNLDGEFISTNLDAGFSSSSLIFDNFRFKIPTGSEISGMQVYVDGRVLGDSTIDVRTTDLHLLDSNGDKVGEKMNSFISLGNDWGDNPELHMWRYGLNTTNWGGILSPELLNSPNFGLSMEIRNHGDQSVEVQIDKVEIVVFYKPAFTLCNEASHLCIPFLGPRSPDILSYSWSTSGNFNELDDDDPKVFNLLLDGGREPGMYEICVEATYATGTEQCCRVFEIVDCTLSNIGDAVWEDINGDGIQDDEEPGVDGIELELFDETDRFIASTTSGGGGTYSFDDIERGCYYVKASNLDGYLPSIGPDNFLDGSNGFGTTDFFTLEGDTTLSNIDLGLVIPATISGNIWEDINADGNSESESGIGGVQLQLDGPTGMRTTQTDDAGNYMFGDLVPGDYKITVSIPNRYELTAPDIGAEDVNSDFNENAMVAIDGVISGDEFTDIDGGLFKRGTIGNFVWYDFNIDGIQDDSESGIGGVLITLMNGDGQVASTTSKDDGSYTFSKVKPGNYHVAYSLDDDYIISLPNRGENDDQDSDVEQLQDTWRTADFDFVSCDSLTNVDAGFIFKPGSIAGTIWSDDSRDHQRQPDESRELSTSVSLFNDQDELIDTQTANAGGTYLFDELQPGNFYVQFESIDDHIFSDANVGSDNGDSDVADATAGTTAEIEITPDLDVTDVDAGYIYLVSSIAGQVWEDENRDNRQGSDENTFSGIEVNLFTGNGDMHSSTTTGSDGSYLFDELRRNDYYITFDGIENYLFVSPNEGSDTENSDVTESVTMGSTDMISLVPDTDLTDIDAGFVEEVGTILGETWEDVNIDGSNNDQAPFEGITVSLFSSDNQELRNTTTGSDGSYIFELVPVGEYYVHFELPADYIYAEANAGNDESSDSDISGASGDGTTGVVSIERQDDERELDGGYVINLGRVAGTIWKDNDEDGQRQSNESRIEGINVSLLDTQGNQIESTSSNNDGEFAFEDITAGDYYIAVDIPSDNIFTVADQGDEATDSDITGANGEGTSDDFEVLTGRRTTFVDAGSVDNFGNILGVAWCDANEDGILEASEELIDGIDVRLLTEEGQEINTTTTQAGTYAFLEVPAGTYYLVFEDEDDKEFTIESVGSDEVVNSAVNSSIVNGSTFVFRVGAGNNDFIRNAGYQYLPGSVSGQAWIDENFNMSNDDGQGFADIRVTLFDNENNEVASTNTDGSGNYNFDNVRRGNYFVTFGESENFFMITSDASNDSDVTNSSGAGSTNIFEVIANRETTDIDAGYYLAVGSVSGQAWIDDNDNATNDDNNPFEGIEVTLFSANGERLVTSTGSDGAYSFENVFRGNYTVSFDSRDDYDFVSPNVGGDDVDSDITGANGAGSTDEITVVAREETQNVDGGYVLGKGSISGLAWRDDNENNINDDQNAFEGIDVTLFAGDGSITTTTTSGDGSYIFEDLFPGTYRISFESRNDYNFADPDVGDENQDSDVTGTDGEGSTDEITVGPREEVRNIDAGYDLQTGSVSGVAWLDINDNDINDDNELISDVRVTLFEDGTEIGSTQTDEDGSYSFDDLRRGSYYVVFQIADEFDFVDANNGDENQDSDVTGANGDGSTDSFDVIPNEDTANVDAGYRIARGAVSGTAWVDINDNNINDDDRGLPGVEVTLLTATGDAETTTTDADGSYSFNNVIPGVYSIQFQTIDNYIFADPNVGDENQDSDVTNEDGTTDEFTIEGRRETENVDAGYFMLRGGIAGSAWKDDNNNGIYEQELPFADITVTLFSEDDREISSTTTNENGNYMFGDLEVGNYYVVFQGIDGYDFSPADASSEDQDSDVTGANGDGSTDIINVIGGEVAEDVDAAYFMIRGEICGLISKDNDDNEIRTEGDEGLGDVLVTLLNSAGDVIQEARTDGDGGYCFQDVGAGDYRVQFAINNDEYEFTSANVGDDDGIDSDVTNRDNGRTDSFTLNGGDRLFFDAIVREVEVPGASISGLVWKDNNQDNVFNEGDDVLEGLGITLLSDIGEILTSTSSGSDGTYIFNDLDDGSYIVFFENRDNEDFVDGLAGDDRSIDSDVISTLDSLSNSGMTDIIVISDGQSFENIDAGVFMDMVMEFGSVSGTAWRDQNDNDIDDDDAGLEGIEVRLFNAAGEELANATTDSDGDYSFTDLEDGSYYVVFEDRDNFDFVDANVGDDDDIDSDVTGSNGNGSTDPFEIEGAEDVENVDAGYFTELELYSLRGRAFIDTNDNGVDDEEEGFGGIQVFLLDSMDVELAATITDEDGSYSFNNLEAGVYVVVFEQPDGEEFITANVGDDDTIDSDVEVFLVDDVGGTNLIQVDGNVSDVDAGYREIQVEERGAICGQVWRDNNKNNINDEDSPIEDVEVILFDEDGNEVEVALTDASGGYNFNELESGNYYIFFDPIDSYDFVVANAGDDDAIDSDVTGGSGDFTTDLISVGTDKVDNIDAGYFTEEDLYSIRGRAFVDDNENDIDDDEDGFRGVQVFLLDSLDVELSSTTTDENGNYSFEDLAPADYVVVFQLPSDSEFSEANVGDDDTVDSDVEFEQDGFGATNIISLNSNVADLDAGIITTREFYSIAGRAFVDENENGIDDDEDGFSGVQVFLLDSLDVELSSTTTDQDGSYSFENLDPNDYVVVFQLPSDSEFSEANAGDDDTVDSDVEFEQDGLGATNIISLDSDVTDVDAGIITTQEFYSIAGRAFIDDNENGLDDDEDGFAGVQVFLLDSLDVELSSTTTDQDGSYSFENLDPNDYVVVFQLPSDSEFSEANAGDDDTVDSDVEFEQDGLGATNIITLDSDITDVDAGIITTQEFLSICGQVWIDLNGNGIRQDEEPPFEGITVVVVDSTDIETASTTTTADGSYCFNNLESGTYAVVFMLPADSSYSGVVGDQGDDDSIDSDPIFFEDDLLITDAIVLNEDVSNIDAGIVLLLSADSLSISGQAWRDVNENNLNDDNAPYAGVEVDLLGEDEEVIASTTTDLDGNYSFDDLAEGNYFVRFASRDNNTFSSADTGDDDNIDSDVITEEGQTDLIELTAGESITNIDAGYNSDLPFYSISGKAFKDIDEDNLNNDDMPFIGIQVFLLDSLDAQAATTMTDSLGNYSFDNVTEGTYAVVFTLPEDYRFSDPNVGEDETIDSDVIADQNNLGASERIVLTGDVTDVDAGYIAVESSGLSIAGNTFIDTDENGLDDDDNPFANVTVVLFDSTDVEITRTTTDEDGAYSFMDIDTGAYYVSFWLDSTYVFTDPNVGDDDTIDSDVTNAGDSSGSTETFDLTESIMDIDAGYISTDTTMVATGSLAGVVWEDTERDGIRQESEPGVPDVEVVLIDSSGDEVDITTTDDSGQYSFDDIEVGEYTVTFNVGDEQVFVLADQGDDDTIDSDASSEGVTGSFQISEDETTENIDAGILTELPAASLCGRVWIDADENGTNDEGEDTVRGIIINIYTESGEFLDSTRTTTNGFYSFADLLGGQYYIEVDTEGDYTFTTANVGDDEGVDSDITGANGDGTTDVFLATGKVEITVGLIPETGSFISGRVFGDTDENNAFNEGDLLIEGQEVFLVNRLARVIAMTTTNADGFYRFDIEASGEYAIFFATDEESTFVEANASGDEETDSDVVDIINLNGLFGTTNLIDFNMGQRIRNIDAGYEMTIEQMESITGVVWMDENEDALRQEDEQLLAGIEVNIFNSDDELIASTTTDQDGAYVFSNLESGDYYIEFVTSSGEFVAADQGDDDSIDSDVSNTENGRTDNFSYEGGDPLSFDAGIMGDVEINTLCGVVWNDADQNNLNDNEQGLANLTVYLLSDGEIIDTTTTGSDGTYSFANLESGTYSVQVEVASGYVFAEQNVGDDDTIDSDVNSSGESGNVEVNGKVTVDAGAVFSVVGISGRVWGDRDEDNVFGDGDLLIEGHTVFLVNRLARVVATTTTAADGTYIFDGLASGTYAVFFDFVDDDVFVEANAGDDESADSDVIDVITEIGPYGITNLVDYEENTTIGNIDAGLVRTPSTTGIVAGVVWIDSEEDAIRQDDEELFGGITVTLFTTDGEEVATTMTDENGAYEFSNVTPDLYYVEFTLLGREFVDANQGDDERVDSDVEDLNSGRSGNFEVEIDLTTDIDAGVKPVQTGICGTVWFDFNENGRLDNDEDGIADNEVKLFTAGGDEVASTNTGSNGSYSFPDVEAGDYFIEVFLSGASDFTESKVGDEEGDSDITNANGDGTSDTFTYENGLLKVDAGQVSIVPSFINGLYWSDDNGDHILNEDEEGIPGVSVFLQSGGEIVDTVTTADDGTYIFDNLPVGNYFVLFTLPADKFFALPNVPDEESTDSDVLSTVEIDGEMFGITEEISIGSGQVKANVDAGIADTQQMPGSIAGQVFLDEDQDDSRDDDEGTLEGVVVTLLNNTGGTVGTQEIGSEGTYSFDNLVPGVYGVIFMIPSEYTFVDANEGDEDRDSDVAMFDGELGFTESIEVGDGENIENIDAGIRIRTVSLSSIGDIVWLDLDEDGIYDDDELGMNEVNVELFDALSGEVVGSTITANHPQNREPGHYSFENLEDGEYYLRFSLPTGYIFSNPKMGTQSLRDSDVTGANGTGTTNTIVVEKVQKTDIDVGAVKTTKAVVGDIVFNDRNANGVQDANEDGINNIRVRLFDADNQQVAQTFTQYNRAMDRSGYFNFKVDAGTYFLRFDISQGLSFTEGDVGDDDEKDSDVTGENGFGTTALFEIDEAETNVSLDAGLITEPANLGDRLWVDENSNGVQDDSEEGIDGIEVSLYDNESNLMITTTTRTEDGKQGFYLFENISAGSYYIGFDLPDEYVSTNANIGGNDAEDSDITNVFGKGTTSLFTLSSGEDELDIDGGIVLGSSIGDYVWEDENGDGIQDGSEPGREGVFVRLLSMDGDIVDTTSTDANGEYMFDGLVLGDYSLEFDIPADRAVTTRSVGDDDDVDSDADDEGNVGLVVVGYNENIEHVDVGLVSNSVAVTSVDNELIANVFPNPTIRFITLQTNDIYQTDTSIKEVRIFDQQGALIRSFNDLKTIKSAESNRYELDMNGVLPGVYYLKAKVGRLTYTKKLILINN